MILFLGRLFGLAIGIISILQTLHDLQKKKAAILPSISWLLIWILIIIISVTPNLIEIIISKTGGKTGIGTVMGVGVVTSIFISYKNYQKNYAIESRLNKLARASAQIPK